MRFSISSFAAAATLAAALLAAPGCSCSREPSAADLAAAAVKNYNEAVARLDFATARTLLLEQDHASLAKLEEFAASRGLLSQAPAEPLAYVVVSSSADGDRAEVRIRAETLPDSKAMLQIARLTPSGWKVSLSE
ncbi:MAG: hypothetical protein IJ802_05750 [Kiritimatiellae bacterium]|nr:hypothetical protein [Kiritimatiellia bacterium]